jgi:hypothetical protein
MNTRVTRAIALALLLGAGTAGAGVVDDLLADYQSAGAGPFDPKTGAALWLQEHPSPEGPRACTTCHTADPTAEGRHATTGKPIAPLAPSARPERLSDRKEIEKWLARNCKWTLGRECSAQEKGDLLVFLRTQ